MSGGETSGVDLARVALRAAMEAARPSRVDPHVAEAMERQSAAMRALSLRAYPHVVPDDAPAPIEMARAQRRRQAKATEAAALRRARAERAGAAVSSAPCPRHAAGEVA
ncbi:hypothetical protein OG393_34390 (plasmid) [Streptomyces sp. NBC_01216]|uniref:hypothetical protein n=1 Tax=Streptomyces sp. NBC_01216 TaxID=2903778 RepID=UPI002E11E04F|nr:hypothetical protein OG393_34390 [Streptomyces sp. NBC_01216]